MKIGPFNLKKGDFLAAAITSNLFNKTAFKEPERFYPERWDNLEEGFD